MKKLLLLIALCAAAATAGAANWVVTHHSQQGQPAYTSYKYDADSIGTVTFFDGDLSLMLINSLNGTFHYQPCTVVGIGKKGNYVTVELYDQCDRLQETLSLWLWKCSDLPTALETKKSKGKVRRIVNHLKSGTGKIRIFAQRERHYPADFYEFLPPIQ